jgi:DDE superfamily endonuclease
MDNGRTLADVGEKNVKYADVVSGGMNMTMFVRISGDPRSQLLPPFMIFKSDGKYPIRGVEDNVPGVSYRVGARGWMDRNVFAEMTMENRALWPLPDDKRRILYIDNCGGHNATDASEAGLGRTRTEVRFLPPNSTHFDATVRFLHHSEEQGCLASQMGPKETRND